MMNADFLPPLNASLNAVAACLLFVGWRAIKRGDKDLHRKTMIAAFGVSALFLVSYLTYHGIRTHETGQGHTVFPHGGWLKVVYLSILATHIPLAVVVVPACLTAIFHALRGNFDKHTRITRWLWPVWMYVSVTGVLIYAMLYHL